MKNSIFYFWAAASLLACQPKPAQRAPARRAPRLARPSPAPRQPGLPPRAAPSSPARRARRRATSRPRQATPAACPPRARLALTTQRAGGLEEERALLPAARALPSLLPRCPSLRPRREPRAPPSPRAPSSALAALELRRRQALTPPHHFPIARAHSRASPSFGSRSRLRRLPSPG